MRLGFDLAAQVLDVGVDGPSAGVDGDAVDRLEQLAAGEHPSWCGGHVRQEVELRGGQLDGTAVDLHRALHRVDDETADDDRPLVVRRGWRLVAARPGCGPAARGG